MSQHLQDTTAINASDRWSTTQILWKGEPGWLFRREISLSLPDTEVGYQAPRATSPSWLNTEQLTWEIESWLNWKPGPIDTDYQECVKYPQKIYCEFSTSTITATNQLIYTTTTGILEVLGYKMNNCKVQYPPWKRRLAAKIKTAQKFASYQNYRKERGA